MAELKLGPPRVLRTGGLASYVEFRVARPSGFWKGGGFDLASIWV
jgi:hypothetical protein